VRRPRLLALVAATAALVASAAACGGEQGAAAGEITALARAWYQDADPAVCDHMTEKMLDDGWGKTGDAGRAECRALVEKADPPVDVVIGSPSIDDDKATVEVTYGPAEDRKIDRLHLVLVDGAWDVDAVAVVATPGPASSEAA
jgi:hypothetical protein